MITPEAGSIARPIASVSRPVRIARGEWEVTAMLEAARPLIDLADAPFCTRSMWLSAWYRSVGARPAAVCVLEDEVPVGLACLAIQRRGPMRTVTLAGHGPGDYGRLPARDADVAAALARAIVDFLRSFRGPWRLVLDQLPVGDPVALALLRALPGARLEAAQASPHLVFGDDRRVERVLSGGTRREVRRGQNRLREAGVTVEIARISDPVGVGTTLPELIDVHRTRDHAVGRRSDLDPPARRIFFGDVVRGLAEVGTLDLWVMRLDGAIGAFYIGVRDGACYRIMDGRMSGIWPSASPAILLRHELTAALLAEPAVSEVDFMRGVLPHKTQDATGVVAAERLLAESSRSVARAVGRWHALKRVARDRTPAVTRRWIALARSRFAPGHSDDRVQGRP